MVRDVGPVHLQVHSWVWLSGSAKALQMNTFQRVGVEEQGPGMVHCGHLQQQCWRGNRRDAKGSLWDQGRDQDLVREKRRAAWAPEVIRGRRQRRECCFPFGQRRVQGDSSVLLSIVLSGRNSWHSWAPGHCFRKGSPISKSPLPQCCGPQVPSGMACWMLQELKDVSRK